MEETNKKNQSGVINSGITKSEFEMDEHQISIDELCRRFDTDLRFGLTNKTAEANLERDGKNVLIPAKQNSDFLSFLRHMFRGFSLLLWLCAGILIAKFVAQLLQRDDAGVMEIFLAVFLIIAVIVSGTFSFRQDRRISVDDIAFKSQGKCQYTEVIRDGKKSRILCEDIVVGDLVLISFGDSIPADVRIIESKGFKVDNFNLTGYVTPQLRTEKAIEQNPLESPNLAFLSTSAVEGTARAIVVRTGGKTLMGYILYQENRAIKMETSVIQQMVRLMNKFGLIGFVMGLFCFLTLMVGHYSWTKAASPFVGVIIGAIPGGLLIASVCFLTITSKRMLAKNCKVKNLKVVETLGSVTTICIHETRYVTSNRKKVTHVWFDLKTVEVFRGQRIDWKEKNSLSFRIICNRATLCNNAKFACNQENKAITERDILGTQTEVGIMRFLVNCLGKRLEKLKEDSPRICSIPFRVTYKYQISVHDHGEHYLFVALGRPEILIKSCLSILIDGHDVLIQDEMLKSVDEVCIKLAQCGETVFCLCDTLLPKSSFPDNYPFHTELKCYSFSDLRLLGLISLFDPPRPSVPNAVNQCRSAGIKIVLVTNDHPITARGMARLTGIISENSMTVEDIAEERKCPVQEVSATEAKAAVVDGAYLKHMSLKEVEGIISHYQEIVFARTAPDQRLMILTCCQNDGSVVAVTGNSVNTSLKRANVSVTGGSSSSVAREIADVVLVDDTFSSLVMGIEEGRLLLSNLKKAMRYKVTSSVPEVAPFLFYCIFGIPKAIGLFAIVIIDFGTDLWPTLALVFEKPEIDLMTVPPNRVQDNSSFYVIFLACFQIGIIETAASFTVFFLTMAANGWYPNRLVNIRYSWDTPVLNDLPDSNGVEWTYEDRIKLEKFGQTAYFWSIVTVQMANLITCRTKRKSLFSFGFQNWTLNSAFLFSAVLAFFFCYIPGADIAFNLYHPALFWWGVILPYAVFIVIYDECRKYYLRACKRRTVS